ncbi:hypothetical protein HZP37_10300 [Elizabethkingia anophelis]|nr:hypothetical protein [Elizabethkingia anophelis]MCT4251477.1 hypothetical protein [Elizabethkingia anophelis]
MILSSLYIIDHFLFEGAQTLNFGGHNFYSFSIDENFKKIYVTVTKNQSYISKFWNKNIQNISAIVGSNGSGKTNILKAINKSYNDKTKSIFIYEDILENDNVKLIIHNRTADFVDDNMTLEGSEYEIILTNGENYDVYKAESIISLFYSAIYDKAIPDFYSLLALESGGISKSLSSIYSETILKQVAFLHNPISTIIKESFPDFPVYNSFKISIKNLSKRDFTQVYSDSNIGNPEKIQTLKISIESDLKEKKFESPESLLRRYQSIIGNDNLFDALQQIWSLPQYTNKLTERSNTIHDSTNFIKNFEIIVLSFLTLNDTFIITGSNGKFDFSKILESSNFEEFLDNFLRKYIISQDKTFESIQADINLANSNELIKTISSRYKKITVSNGINTSMYRDKMLRDIDGLNNILDFYKLINVLQADKESTSLTFFINNTEVVERSELFFELYSKIVDYFSNIPGINPDFLDVTTDINLSYGEKCLLNLYSTIFSFTVSNDHTRKRENYLIILDEADLGYHPMWKRKFVDTLNKTFPIIFSILRPMIYDGNSWLPNPHYSTPNIQIIFTTHDPISLSDIPNNNVVYLKRNNGFTKVLEFDDIQRPTQTFGANISDLIADSFFIIDGLIGDFVKEKIEGTIEWINNNVLLENRQTETFNQELIYHKKLISIIDEPIIKLKLSEMISELEDSVVFQKEIIAKEIELLKQKYDKL